MIIDRSTNHAADTTAAVMEYVSAIFAPTPAAAQAFCRLLREAGIPAQVDSDVAACVPVLVPDDQLEVATEILAKRRKDVEEEEEFDDEEDDLEDDEEDDDEDEEEDFEEEEFEEEFEDEELDDDEDDIFYDDDDDE